MTCTNGRAVVASSTSPVSVKLDAGNAKYAGAISPPLSASAFATPASTFVSNAASADASVAASHVTSEPAK